MYQLYDKSKKLYRAFCAGSIITEKRVITSSHCFLTNRKRRKRNFNNIKIAGGILNTKALYQPDHNVQQWRSIDKLYSQRFYRFPAYNLAILKVNEEWNFNEFINKIPFAMWNQDFDGVCYGTTVRTTKSWSDNKSLFAVAFHLIPQRSCERKLLRSCRLFYCSQYDTMTSTSIEIEGGGLICYGTNDPAEEEQSGVLVGVTALINVGLPSLHNRVGLHYTWVYDRCVRVSEIKLIFLLPIILFYVA